MRTKQDLSSRLRADGGKLVTPLLHPPLCSAASPLSSWRLMMTGYGRGIQIRETWMDVERELNQSGAAVARDYWQILTTSQIYALKDNSVYSLVSTNPLKRAKTNNELILLTIIVCVSKAWFSFFLCAIELHCWCPNMIKNSMSHMTCSFITMNTHCYLFRHNPTYTVLLPQILSRAPNVYEPENSPTNTLFPVPWVTFAQT